MIKNNYTGIFCLHPNFAEQWHLFNQNIIIQINNNCNLQELITKSSLLITDYSSIFFDFGYIEKPVIYTQFDYIEFRSKHFPVGYFNYEKNGFGPICYDIHNCIKTIINEIRNNAKLKRFYLRRIKQFFKYIDDKNCFRIYSEITKQSKTVDTNEKIVKKLIYFILILLILIKKQSN